MNTVHALGTDYPVIAELDDGYMLAAHPNGPIIASEDRDMISVLEWNDKSPIDESIHAQAWTEYRKATWPLVRDALAGLEMHHA